MLVGAVLLFALTALRMRSPAPLALLEPATPTPIPTSTPDPYRNVRGTVTDLYTASPIVSATVSVADRQAATDEQGRYEFERVPIGALLSARADDHREMQASLADSATIDFKLQPTYLAGTVTDASTGDPLPGARLYLGSVVTQTDHLGRFRLANVPPEPVLTVKLAGYAKTEVRPGRVVSQEVRLKPFAVKAVYLTYSVTGWKEQREAVFDLIDRSELNAVVIDVKGDRGLIVYPTDVPLAKKIGADEPMVEDFDKLMASLKQRRIYTIARIVVFKDDKLARARPDLAVRIEEGGPYIDWEDLQWVDPFQRDVWEYNIALAEEAVRKGFDEVQFDYVRFPSEGVGGTVYSRDSTQASRLEAINGFVAAANRRLQPLGVFTAVDLFGWTLLRDDDIGIGQLIEGLAPHVDYIAPMVYPSTWLPGSAEVDEPVDQPYDIVYRSVKKGVERLQYVPTVRVRPWLQDFYDYGPRKVRYGEPQVRAQIKASTDAKAAGWMLWDPQAKYTEEALEKE